MIQAYIEDDGFTKGAALAYYTTFSIAPIVIVIVAVAGFVFGKEAVRGELFAQLDDLMGADTATQIQELVEASYNSGDTWWATILGVATLLFAATGAFNQLKLSLDAIWEIESKPSNSILGFLVSRVTSFAMVLGIGFILLVSLVVNAVAVGLSGKIGEYFSIVGEISLAVIGVIVSIAMTAGVFALIFKYLADVRIRWREVLWGSLFTAVLFSLGRFGISYYIGNSTITSGFGAAGSLVALLVWTYYSSQIVFLGAEFIWTLGRETGHPVLPSKSAVQIIKKTKRIEASEAERVTKKDVEQKPKPTEAGGLHGDGNKEELPTPASPGEPFRHQARTETRS